MPVVEHSFWARKMNSAATAPSVARVCLGGIVRLKLLFFTSSFAWLTALCLFALSGCGGGSGSGANVVTVSVSSSQGTFLIVGESTNLTATVSGATNTNVKWQPCQFTTTPTTGTNPKTSAPAACPMDGSLGTLSNELDTGTATYTAPGKLPDQTKFPNLQIVITAQSQQDTKKTGAINLTLDSGISVTLTPLTATVPTKEPQQFTVALTNDLQTQGVTWLITQNVPSSTGTTTTNFPQLPTCSPSCGTITPDANNPDLAVYTAPATVPTSITPAQTNNTNSPANVTVVATSKADTNRVATGTITIIQGGPITFNGISPTIAPQGATFWDIFLDAPEISSSSSITLSDSQNQPIKTFASGSGQIKVLFPIPTSTTANPTSSGARLRLLADDLKNVGQFTVSVTDPGEPVTDNPAGVFTFSVLPVRPTSISSAPDSILQGSLSNDTKLTIDGGYFGPNGQLAQTIFQGNTIPNDSRIASNSRQLNLAFPTNGINSGSPGLYPLSVSGTGTPSPSPNNPSVTTLAVFPDYRNTPPAVVGTVAAGTNPSAIDIDPTLGVAVVAETGSNAIQFYSIGNASLTPLGNPITSQTFPNVSINTPTGVSVNRTNHTVAVINYGDQSVTVLPIPGAPVQAPGTPFSFSISGALQNVFQGSTTPAPIPYAIGVDPDTNLALVAYSSTSPFTTANLGFVVNLNPDIANSNPYGCPLGNTITPPQGAAPVGQCLYSQVTLNTGTYPQIAMAPHGHLAIVTPGGSGVVQGVDVTQASSHSDIASVTLTAGVVTVLTKASIGLIPGNAGTVLITGVQTAGSGKTNFNGIFPVQFTGSNSFSYVLNPPPPQGDVDTGTGGTVFFGGPNLLFGGLPQTAQGISINPITRTAGIANANALGGLSGAPQIDFLNSLDQSVTSIRLSATCTAFSTSCSDSPELLGTADVAWQPYTNSLVSYNPGRPGTPVDQVSISDPVSLRRFAIVPDSGQGSATLTVGANTLTLFGGLAVDPPTNQALVVQSGSGTIDIIDLGPNKGAGGNNIKPTQITELLVPSPTPGPGAIGGIPNALFPQATLTSATDLSGVQIFGSGFSGGAQVRLDGVAVPPADVQVVSAREIIATIPASFLSLPHRYALDVLSGGVPSNVTDFFVIKSVDMTPVCNPGPPLPSSVAIADQLANGPFSPIAVVSNSGCGSISTIDVNPASLTFGTVLNTIAVGADPQGVAISQHLALAVVANNGDGTASVVDLTKNKLAVPSIATGTNPTGVAINDATGAAIVANTGSNTVSEINLMPLFASTPATTLTPLTVGGIQQPIAVAIDPDRGPNNQGIAVVTSLQLVSGSVPNGALAVLDIGLASPSLSTTSSTGFVTATPTGLVFDPAAPTNSQHPGLFYANSSGSNVITSFNPDNGGSSSVSVGINPTALAVNPQTGAILTSNVAGKTISIVDTLSNPFKTRQTFGLPGSPQFCVAIDQFTNLAVIVDQLNNRVFLFPMPN